MSTPLRMARAVLAWPVESQLGSRRNALIASTALTQLRKEREEVEDFLAARISWAAAVPEALPERRDVI